MSQTTRVETTTFIHNGDYSGHVTIISGSKQIDIPMDHVCSLVADMVLSHKVGKLEDATTNEILGME